jgi:protein-tyrosine phosphatase
MPHVLDWRSAAEPRELVSQAARALAEGHLVAFPTETVYGLAASALAPEAVERLHRARGEAEDRPLPLAVRGAGDALDWVPGMSRLGRRLARRCWPGPVTLVFGDGVERGLAGRLPEAVRRRVCPAGTIGLRTPAHAAVLRTLRRAAGPVVLTSAARADGPAAVLAEQVVESFGDEVAVVLDDGPCRFGQASTVVQVNGSRWSVLREGVVPAGLVERQTACLIVFVCTGNTCRSPLAEALCKKLLAERLGCAVEELPRRGFQVLSAGLAAMMEGPAAKEAVAVAGEYGADLSGHRSRPLTADLVAQADYLVAMTHSHLLAVADQYPRLGPRPQLFSPEGEDVADPIGCDQQVYQECAAQMWHHLQRFVAELPGS